MSAARISARATLAVGLVVGSSVTLAAFGALGSVLNPGRRWLLMSAVVCIVAGVADARGVRVRPQNRLQVPERWRRTMRLPLASFLYGLLLGTGVAGAVPAAALWALLLVVLALGSPMTALAIGVALGVGRFLPVIVLRPDSIAERPAALRVVRLLAACAIAAAAVSAFAGASTAATTPDAGDPSAASDALAWQQPGVGGFLYTASETKQLPGTHPAVGGALIAWREGQLVTVAARNTLTPLFQEQIVGVRDLALSDSWLVMRTVDARGGSRLIAQSIANTNAHKIVAGVAAPNVVGRPSVSGTIVAFAIETRIGSWITAVDLTTDKARRVRRSTSHQLLNPSLLGGDLLYVDSSRCSQQLRLEPLDAKGGRALLTLPPAAGADAGFQRGYSRQGRRTPCAKPLRTTTTVLWTTALSTSTAYVTTLHPLKGGATTPSLVEITR